MKYSHIMLDVGAVEKHYKAIWINPGEFKKVITYLGDFQDFMHFVNNCGNFFSNSELKRLQECVQWVE